MVIEIRLVYKCIWCDEVDIPMDKQFCSMKCFKEARRACEEQNGKDSFGFDISEIAKRPSSRRKGK